MAPPETEGNARGGLRRMLTELTTSLDDAGRSVELWFVRKQPGLRIRLRATDGLGPTDELVARAMTSLVERRVAGPWFSSVYEPEVHAFGGEGATEAAHGLFVGSVSAWCALDAALVARSCAAHPHVMSLAALGDLFQRCVEDEAELWDVWAGLASRYRDPVEEIANPMRVSLTKLARLGGGQVSDIIDRYRFINGEYAEAISREWSSGRLRRGRRAVLRTVAAFHWNIHGVPSRDIARICRAMARAWDGDRDGPLS